MNYDSIRRRWSRLLFTALVLIGTSAASVSALGVRPTDPNAPPPPAWVQWFPILVMFAVFYFLMIRPQMRQRKERQSMLDALKKGDKIVTSGGFIATVVNMGPTILEVKLNDDTKVKIQRSAVAEILPEQADTSVNP